MRAQRGGEHESGSMQLRDDLAVIARNIPAGSRVLDLGCGDGELLSWLIRRRACTGTGLNAVPMRCSARSSGGFR